MKKRIVGIVLAAVFALAFVPAFSSCGAQRGEGPLVVATIFPQYDLARTIAGDGADVKLLVRPGGDSHSYEPTPADMTLVADCDLFIYIGGEGDEWARDLIEAAEKKPEEVLALIEKTPTLEEVHEGEEEHGHEADEHIWTSPKNALLMAEAIFERLAETNPPKKAEYRANYEKLAEKISELDKNFADYFASHDVFLAVADRFPFLYFAHEYGLEYIAAFPGCSSETEPSLSTMKKLVDKVRSEKIPAVFYVDGSSRKTADAVAEEVGGTKVLLLHSCHNVTAAELEESYASLMSQNLERLKSAFGE